MFIGALIRAKRKEFGWSQSYLCKGICVSSHLSKIENGEFEPTDDIKRLILERLNISEQFDEDYIEKYQKEINEFHRLFFFFYKKEASEKVSKIKKQGSKLKYSPLHLDYYLVCYADYVINNNHNCKKAKDTCLYLETHYDLMSDKHQYFFEFYKTFIETSESNQLEKLSKLDGNGQVVFRLSRRYEAKGMFYKALESVEVAKDKFLMSGNLRGLFLSLLFKGSYLFNMASYEDAIRVYQAIDKLVNSSKSSDPYINSFKYFALSNIADCYLKLNDLEQMKDYALLAIDSENIDDDKIYGVFPYILMCHYCLSKDNYSEAEKYLRQGENQVTLSQTQDRSYEIYQLKKYRMMIEDKDYSKKASYLELLLEMKESMISNQLTHLVHAVNKELETYYINHRQYKKALDVTKKI
ncbi:MAG: helix-turn-helix transcriptional regulator [Clostridiales bacterium]|nr:helix-turn-helix transcriptional regulator [Clostridiales bacterium]